MSSDTGLVSTQDLLGFPEDGSDRELVRGRLRERPALRDRRTARTLAKLSYLICNWLDQQPQPHGEVLLRAPLIRLRRTPDTTIGPDLAYIPAESARRLPQDAYLIDEVPSLVVEVLSQLDDIRGLSEKVIDCLGAGVKLVWIADTRVRAITAYSADAEPIVLHRHDKLTGEPALPGFQVLTSVVFG